jgi:hypothetical protein
VLRRRRGLVELEAMEEDMAFNIGVEVGVDGPCAVPRAEDVPKEEVEGAGEEGVDIGVPKDFTLREEGGVRVPRVRVDGPGLSMYISSMRFVSCRKEVDILKCSAGPSLFFSEISRM